MKDTYHGLEEMYSFLWPNAPVFFFFKETYFFNQRLTVSNGVLHEAKFFWQTLNSFGYFS